MPADGLGLLVGGGEVLLLADHQLKGAFKDIKFKFCVKVPFAADTVKILQFFRRLLTAADRDLPAAHAPQQELYIALHVAEVCLGKIRPAEPGGKHGHAPVFTLQRHLEGSARFFKIGLCPDTEGDKALVEQGLVFVVIGNAEIIHNHILAKCS